MPAPSVFALDAPASLAGAVAALPAEGPLPWRTVLVRSERHAHALRRALVRAGAERVLAGTRFLGPLTAAREILHAAGVAFTGGEETLRPARLAALFREDLALERFDPALLRDTLGWDEAFGRAIEDLEGAGLSPADLPDGAPLARDLARIWARAAADAGASLSAAGTYLRAAALLEREPRAWPTPGPVVAPVDGHEDAALARFLRAIPGVRLGLRAVRPARERHLARVEALYGAEARALAAAAAGPGRLPRAGDEGGSPAERELLAAHLFAPPAALAAPGRPRSAGPDGTVHLEEHAGVEAEIEAAASWVARMVLERRLPLEEIAVLVPVRDPLAGLVAERVARLPLEDGALPVYVAGGVPAVSSAAGARLLAVVRALRAHLSAEAVALVLPALRLEPGAPGAPGEGKAHLTHGEATALAFSLGTAGGNAARPQGALEWPARVAARVASLEAALARARRGEDSTAREGRRLARALADLRAVRPALDALAGVARTIVSGAPLGAVWEALSSLLSRWLLLPGGGPPLPPRLGEALAPLRAGSLGARLSGGDALAAIEERLLALRDARGRFGEPAVFVGTVAAAAGLDFGAVRVIGLGEGALPSAPREDPVLPEGLRAELERAVPGRVLPRAEDRVAAELHALFAAVTGARDAVVLSAPRVDLARTEREPASLLLEAAAALGRPGAPGEAAPTAPGGDALRLGAFGPAREDAAAFRAAHPVSGAAWLDRVARVGPDLPPEWTSEPALGLARVAALRALEGPLGGADGVFDAGGPFPPVPGVAPELPVSASALKQLLQCPRMFLMRRVLGWEEPAAAPGLREIDPAPFGTLLHRVLEAFYRAHGTDFTARARSLAAWRADALDLSDRLFDAFLVEYPLLGEKIRDKERGRLRDGVRAFLEYDWALPLTRHVGVEIPFGEAAPLAVAAGDHTLHVRGYIDRVDVEGGRTLVRDVKTGRARRRSGREAGPTPVEDVQLGLYVVAARALAGAWRTPADVAGAYAHTTGRGEVVERAFRHDAGALEAATREWLATAARLLHGRAFPPSADEGDCGPCPFRPLCGTDGPRRAREGLAEAEDGALAAFRALKLDEEDEP